MSGGVIDEQPAAEDEPQRRRYLRWPFLVVILIALLPAAVYAKLTRNISHIEVTREDLGDARPAKASTDALNILVVGSDQRDDRHAGERADIIMLVHLSPTRNEAAVISFPRDSLVQLPACRSGERRPGQQRRLGMINSSFSFGGIGCTWKTMETLTGIHIDHFVTVDFTGFKGMVDAIGGVDLCIPEPIRDNYVQLDLPAGWQTLQGEEALGYVRTRHSIGDRSDIGRIQRQQDFVVAMAKKTLNSWSLVNPVRLFGFLNTATKSITTDPALTLGVMLDLGLTARRLSPGQVHFVITPWRYSTSYPGRIEWLQGPAKKLFRSIAADKPLTGTKEGDTQSNLPPPTETGAVPYIPEAAATTTAACPLARPAS